MIDDIRDIVKHYWEDHKKVVIAVGVVIIIAYIL
jgi:hypothetical protein